MHIEGLWKDVILLSCVLVVYKSVKKRGITFAMYIGFKFNFLGLHEAAHAVK